MSGLPLKSDASVPVYTSDRAQHKVLASNDSAGTFSWSKALYSASASFGSSGSAIATFSVTYSTLPWTPTGAMVSIDSGTTGPTICANIYQVTTTGVSFKATTSDASNIPAFTARVLVFLA